MTETELISVLLIEDDFASAEIVKGLVEAESDTFKLEWVSHLRTGLERLAGGGIDLVLLDFGLPDSSGLSTFQRAHEHAPGVAIIPLTATGDEALALRAIQLGAQDYLFKGSINRQLLTRSMRYAVERKRGEEALRRAHDELEQRVRERTAELSAANALLTEQIAERRRAEEELRRLSHRLVEVQESERRNIARELHDEIGQLLTGLKLVIEMGARLPGADVHQQCQTAQSVVNELMARVRQLSLDLRPAMLDDLGLLHALLWQLERYTSQTGVRVVLTHIGIENQRLIPEVETAAYRIVQEALTNVARHAGVDEVKINVSADAESLLVKITDQGNGFDAQGALATRNSSGLAGMRERAQLLGGKLLINSVLGEGTSVIAILPLDE
ncbi:MAG TPA: response regulator [Blastocatellia bacterium]|nr:response regulator [Blastocatellia bacterium]HMZ20602.1 response regulator [Blastocatellia bacterium]HNG34204.1 response regulator [Blastocatellia bacterium]